MAGGWKEYQWEESERRQEEREQLIWRRAPARVTVPWSGMRQDLQVEQVVLERDVVIEW